MTARNTSLNLSTTLILLILHATRPVHAQFQHWFWYYSVAYKGKWNGQCDKELSAPRTEPAWCEDISDCILAHSPETQKANMAGAGVLMGLVPSVLSTIAPSLEEMALLFDHRPFLCFLISAGSPGIYITRLFSDTDPELPLKEFGESHHWNLWTAEDTSTQILLSIFQYTLAIGSITNTVWIAVDLGYKSIVSWSCPRKWWVMGWTISPIAIYMTAAIVFKITSSREKEKHVASNIIQWLWRYEFLPCSQRRRPSYKVNKRVMSQMARYIAPGFSYAHLVLGTSVLSSLLYIPFRDAIPLVARWIASGIMMRSLVAYELACLAQCGKKYDCI
jgi:hypothetical protein